MKAYKQVVGTVTWVVLDSGSGNLGSDLKTLLERKPPEILVDFSMVTTVNSADATALARHIWSARRYGAKIVLGAVRNASIRRFLDKSGFTEYFRCEATIPEAIAHFQTTKKNLLGEMLVINGHIDDQQLEEALEIQQTNEKPVRLGAVLQEKGYINSSTLIRALFKQKQDLLAA